MTITAPSTTTVILPEGKTASVAIKADVDRLREVRAAIKVLEAEKDTLTSNILTFAGAAKFLTWGKTKLCSIVDSKSVRADLSILKQVYPDAYAASYTETPYKQVR